MSGDLSHVNNNALKRIQKGKTMSQQNPIIEYFAYAHLPEHLQAVSKPIGELAELLDKSLPNGPEKSAGLRKLLEAKDCFVRASISSVNDAD